MTTIFVVKKQNRFQTRKKSFSENVICFKNKNKAYVYSLIQNFKYIEQNTPFYDSLDEYNNNFYFKDTPQAKFQIYFPNIVWDDYKTFSNFKILKDMSLKSLEKMLKIQNSLIYPDYNNKADLSETYFYVEKLDLY